MQKLNDSTRSIEIKCQGAATLPLSDLLVFQGNLKKLSKKNLDKLKARIVQSGFCAPFFIWRYEGGNFILDGTQRRSALIALQADGYTVPDLPVVWIEAETEARAREIILSVSSQYGEWVDAELKEWIDAFDDEIKETLRLVDKEIRIPGPQTVGDDEVADVETPTTKPGDLIEMNGHRLLCGDSSDARSYDKLFASKRCALVFTDPPYGVSIGDKNKMLDKFDKAGRVTTNINNDTMSVPDLNSMLVKCFSLLKANSEDCCSYYVTAPQGGELGMMMMMMMKESGLPIKHIIIWVKNRACFSLGRLDYDYKHEPILFTWNKRHEFYGEGNFKSSVWTIDKELKCDVHPTMKPVALVENAILNSSQRGDIVSDIFCGSGTTIIAAEKTKRIAYAMENDPHYCDVIIQRFKNWCAENSVPCTIKINGQTKIPS